MREKKHFGRGALRTKLTAFLRTSRRATLLVVPISLIAGMVLAALPIKQTFAAVPTMRWIDSATIAVSGGDLQGTVNVVGAANPNNGLAWMGHADVTHKDGCKLGFYIDVPAGTNGAASDFSKARLNVTRPDAGTDCFTDGPHQGDDKMIFYGMGIENGKLYTIANVNNRGNEGEPEPDPVVDDPAGQQIINVKLNTGWRSIYTTPNPSNPPKADELVPQEDLWILCGNGANPPKSWDPYRNSVGTPDYERMKQDCLSRKSGWVITTTRGPIKTDPIRYEGQFTGVRHGDYVVCDFITNSCQAVTKEPGRVLTVDSWPGTANPTAKVPGSETDVDGTVEEPELGCDVTFDITTIFSLKWLVCPIVNTATFAVGKFEDVINNMLTVDTDEIFDDTAGDNAFHKAWNSFRYFALGLIVIAALIMVVSQAAGVDIVDAYTIKKILPRLLFAAVFIALSWDILEFLTQLSNDAGNGVRTIIYAPFQALNENNQLGGGSSFVLTLIGTGAALAFGWVGLLSFALTGLLAVLVAFAVLVFRKMLILLLVMMAPFAIAAYVLPNTNKLWDLWKGGLLSVLIVFPIISAFIAIGRVFAITSFNATDGVQTVNQIMAVIAYFAPYFLISLAFRLAGGFIATIGGFVNDRSRGAFDRLRNFRGNRMNENMTKMREGRRFADNNPLSRAFNTTTLGLGTGVRGRFGLGGRGAEARDQTLRRGMADIMNSGAYKAIQEDDNALRAATYGSAGEAFRGMVAGGMAADEARRAVNAVQTSVGFGRAQQLAAAQGMSNTGTAFADMQDMVETLGRASGGNASTAASLAGFANFQNKNKGRHDLAPGFGNLNTAVRRQAGIDPGGPMGAADYDASSADGHTPAGLNEAAWRSADPVTVARDRTPGYRRIMEHFAGQYERAMDAYTTAQAAGNQMAMQEALLQAQQAEAAIFEQEQSRMYASGENNVVLNEVTTRVAQHREWLDSLTPANAQPQQVVTRDPTNPNNLIYTMQAGTYAAQARSRARIMQPRDPNREP